MRKPETMRWLFAFALGLFMAGALLMVYGALEGARRERELQHQMVAERMVDELERGLSEILAREEGRPFLHWRAEYVPDAQMADAIATSKSPLVDLPTDPWLLGWFQLDEAGAFSSPHDGPLANEEVRTRVDQLRTIASALQAPLDVGVIGEGQSGEDIPTDPQRADQEQEVAQDGGQGLELVPQRVQQAPKGSSVALQQKLNRGAKLREDRQAVAYNPPVRQLDNFLDQAANVDDEFVGGNERTGTEGLSLDVLVTPMRAVRTTDQIIVLMRRVTIGDSTFRQAVVVDRPSLHAHLADQVVEAGGLGGEISVAWRDPQASVADAGGYQLNHVFAHPFEALAVTVIVEGIASSLTTRWIAGLAIAILVLLMVALLAVYRETAATLAHARARTDFVAAVTHELRTPLTSIRMYAEMLEADMISDGEKQQQYHRTIRSEAERLGRLVEQVLTLARLERRGEPPREARSPLCDVIADLERVWAPQASEGNIELKFHVDRSVADVEIETDFINQVLTNLIDNAIKFTSSASPKGSPHAIEVRAEATAQAVRISVLDEGPGVDARSLRNIFEPFVRGERELTRKTKGTGIGLAVVRGLVEERGGRVWAENRSQGGLAVRLELPNRMN